MWTDEMLENVKFYLMQVNLDDNHKFVISAETMIIFDKKAKMNTKGQMQIFKINLMMQKKV